MAFFNDGREWEAVFVGVGGESSLGAHCDTLGPTAQSIAPGMRGRKVCGHKERAGRIGASFTKPITAALTAMACAPLCVVVGKQHLLAI